jgi:hypothetical protein
MKAEIPAGEPPLDCSAEDCSPAPAVRIAPALAVARIVDSPKNASRHAPSVTLERSVPRCEVLAACQFPQSGRTSIVPRLGDGVPGRDLDGLLQAAALDDVEPADRLPGLGERTVGDERLPVTDTHGRGAARRGWSPVTQMPRAWTSSSQGKLSHPDRHFRTQAALAISSQRLCTGRSTDVVQRESSETSHRNHRSRR